MILSYFDSSVLLAILLDEKRQEEAFGYWQNSIRVSSILLRIETIICLRRTYENNSSKLEKDWLIKKTKILDEYLYEVNYMVINNRIEREIHTKKDLAHCRSLDAIHIATALRFREINNNEKMNFFSFDKIMIDLAKHYKFETNDLTG